jgi:hypothetical protein
MVRTTRVRTRVPNMARVRTYVRTIMLRHNVDAYVCILYHGTLVHVYHVW